MSKVTKPKAGVKHIKCLIIYENGFIQYKNVIPQYVHDNIIKPLLYEAHLLEIDKLDRVAKAIKSYVDKCYGNYITDESPIYNGIETGVLELPQQQGGNQKIKVQII